MRSRSGWPFDYVLCHTDADCVLPDRTLCCRRFTATVADPGYQAYVATDRVRWGRGVSNPSSVITEYVSGDGCSSECIPGMSEDDPSTPATIAAEWSNVSVPQREPSVGTVRRLWFENQTGFNATTGPRRSSLLFVQ